MSDVTRISAFVSTTTRDRLERFAVARGLKKGAVIEAALQHHLQALDELPVDLVVPARFVLTPESFERLVDSVVHPPPPTDAMKALMSGQAVGAMDD